MFECLRTEARIGRSAASVASFHRPRQPGVIRPMASTWVASMQNIAAPDNESVLMWVKCQSFALPFSAEYWHIGATMMRLGSVSSRRRIGENRALMVTISGAESGRSLQSKQTASIDLINHFDDRCGMSNAWNRLPQTQRVKA